MFKELKGIIAREWTIMIRSPRMVFQAFLEPALYFLLFIPIMAKSIGSIDINGMTVPYPLFVLPGIIIYNAFSNGQYAGIKTYIDKLSGELEMLYGLPISRGILLVGKMFYVTISTVLQCLVLIGLANLFVKVANLNVIDYLLMLVIAIMFSWLSVLVYSGLSAMIKSQDSFNIIVNMVTMPLLFTSTVFYPIRNFPSYLTFIAKINPLTYAVDLMRKIMFTSDFNLLLSFFVLVCLVAVTFVISKQCLQRSLQ